MVMGRASLPGPVKLLESGMHNLLPLGLGIIMFSLGLGLTLDDFRRALGRPRALLLGLLAQMVLLPLTAFFVTQAFGLGPEAAMGLMILAACPGGVMAGAVTHLARGETALSISLTAVTSLCAIVTVPLVLGMSLRFFLGENSALQLPLGTLIGGLLLITVLPVSLGLWLRESGRAGRRTRIAVERIAAGVFGLIVFYTFLEYWPTVVDKLPAVGPACIALNLLTMATGAGLGWLASLDTRARIALAMECGFQNNALGITIAISLLSQPALAVPSAVYTLAMYVTALAVIAARAHYSSYSGAP